MLVKLAITTSTPDGLSAYVSPQFENSPYITFVTVEDGNVTDVYSIPLAGGFFFPYPMYNPADIVVREGAEILITASIMPQSRTMLEQRGIKILSVEPYLTVQEAVEKYKNGELTEMPTTAQPPVAPTYPQPPSMPKVQPPPMQFPFMQFPFMPMAPPRYQPPTTPPAQMPPMGDRESFIKFLERQRWMLEQQKWMLEQQKDMLEKQLSIISSQLEKIKAKIEELKSS
ncbi:MAG TPA: hypothetical protein ENF53_02730 [Thermoprotei archaeon]|nr:hypothetical protein [Thermoprotei archaeon]